MERCARLARHTEEPGRITRTFLSAPMRDVHRDVAEWMREANLDVRIDDVGNVVGRRESANPGAKTFVIGSHLDTVPNAGAYDGILGVVAAIEAAAALADEALPFHLVVVGFSEEEGVRFGTPFIGSRAFAGAFDDAMLGLKDSDGMTLADAIRSFGLDPGNIAEAALPEEGILGFLEIHIEQGPVLERRNVPVAVVDRISGQTRLQCDLAGETRHAGTTPMNARRDALAGAAEVVLAVERLGRSGSADVMTVGQLKVRPNVSNCIPGSVELSVDIRHADEDTRRSAEAGVMREAERIAADRGLAFRMADRRDTPCVVCDAGLSDALAASVQAVTGEPAFHHDSGAGHDAMIMARAVGTAMLFVRCRDGISHHPDESVAAEDVAVAVGVAVDCLRRIGGERA